MDPSTLKKTYSKVKAALAKAAQEENSETLVEWLFTCTDVRTLLAAAAARIKVLGPQAKSSDVTLLKRTYTKAKTALGNASKDAVDNDTMVEWLFSCAELRTLLLAAAEQIKTLPGTKKDPGRQKEFPGRVTIKEEVDLCGSDDDIEETKQGDQVKEEVIEPTAEHGSVSEETCAQAAQIEGDIDDLINTAKSAQVAQVEGCNTELLDKIRIADERVEILEAQITKQREVADERVEILEAQITKQREGAEESARALGDSETRSATIVSQLEAKLQNCEEQRLAYLASMDDAATSSNARVVALEADLEKERARAQEASRESATEMSEMEQLLSQLRAESQSENDVRSEYNEARRVADNLETQFEKERRKAEEEFEKKIETERARSQQALEAELSKASGEQARSAELLSEFRAAEQELAKSLSEEHSRADLAREDRASLVETANDLRQLLARQEAGQKEIVEEMEAARTQEMSNESAMSIEVSTAKEEMLAIKSKLCSEQELARQYAEEKQAADKIAEQLASEGISSKDELEKRLEAEQLKSQQALEEVSTLESEGQARSAILLSEYQVAEEGLEKLESKHASAVSAMSGKAASEYTEMQQLQSELHAEREAEISVAKRCAEAKQAADENAEQLAKERTSNQEDFEKQIEAERTKSQRALEEVSTLESEGQARLAKLSSEYQLAEQELEIKLKEEHSESEVARADHAKLVATAEHLTQLLHEQKSGEQEAAEASEATHRATKQELQEKTQAISAMTETTANETEVAQQLLVELRAERQSENEVARRYADAKQSAEEIAEQLANERVSMKEEFAKKLKNCAREASLQEKAAQEQSSESTASLDKLKRLLVDKESREGELTSKLDAERLSREQEIEEIHKKHSSTVDAMSEKAANETEVAQQLLVELRAERQAESEVARRYADAKRSADEVAEELASERVSIREEFAKRSAMDGKTLQQALDKALAEAEAEERAHSSKVLSEYRTAEEKLKNCAKEASLQEEAVQKQSSESTACLDKLKQLLVDKESMEGELTSKLEAEKLARAQEIEELNERHASTMSAMSDERANETEAARQLLVDLRAERQAENEVARRYADAKQSANEVAEQLANERVSMKEEFAKRSAMDGKTSQQALDKVLAAEAEERAHSSKVLSEYRTAEEKLKNCAREASLQEKAAQEQSSESTASLDKLKRLLVDKESREGELTSKLDAERLSREQEIEEINEKHLSTVDAMTEKAANETEVAQQLLVELRAERQAESEVARRYADAKQSADEVAEELASERISIREEFAKRSAMDGKTSRQSLDKALAAEAEERAHSSKVLSEYRTAEEKLKQFAREASLQEEAVQKQSSESTASLDKLNRLLVDTESREEALTRKLDAGELARAQETEELKQNHASRMDAMSEKTASETEAAQQLLVELRTERQSENEVARRYADAKQSAEEIAEQFANERVSMKEEIAKRSAMDGKTSKQALDKVLASEAEERALSSKVLSEYRTAEEKLKNSSRKASLQEEAAQKQTSESLASIEKLKRLLVEKESREKELTSKLDAANLARTQEIVEMRKQHESTLHAMSEKHIFETEQFQRAKSTECEEARQCALSRRAADEMKEELAKERNAHKAETDRKVEMDGVPSQQALESQLAKESAEHTRSLNLVAEYRTEEAELKKHVASLKDDLNKEKQKSKMNDASHLQDKLSLSEKQCKQARDDTLKLETKLKAQQQLVEKTKKDSAARIADLEKKLTETQAAASHASGKRKVKSDDDIMVHETFWAKRPRTSAGNTGSRLQVQRVRRYVDPDFEICWDFSKRGVCPRGSRCTWRHPPKPNKQFIPMAVKEEPEDD